MSRKATPFFILHPSSFIFVITTTKLPNYRLMLNPAKIQYTNIRNAIARTFDSLHKNVRDQLVKAYWDVGKILVEQCGIDGTHRLGQLEL